MKTLVLSFVALCFAQLSFAGTLVCWKTDFTNVKTPFMTAEINAPGSLSNIRFLYRNSEKDAPELVNGDVITSNHSPYKGNQEFSLSNGDWLILPVNLSNANLVHVETNGIGYYKGENGALIGNTVTGDNEAGTHYSYRLNCRSNE